MKNEKGFMRNGINSVCDMGPKTGHIKVKSFMEPGNFSAFRS